MIIFKVYIHREPKGKGYSSVAEEQMLIEREKGLGSHFVNYDSLL